MKTTLGTALLAVLCLMASAETHAAPTSATSATWTGSVLVNERPVAVRLTEGAPGGAATWHYGAPRSCDLEATPLPAASGERAYSLFSRKGGRHCDRLSTGRLTLRAIDERTLTFEAVSPEGGTRDAGKVSAGEPAATSVVGTWVGTVTVGGKPLPIDLVLNGPAGSAVLHYGGSRSCALTAEYAGEHAGRHFLPVTRSNGGFCDKILGGHITVAVETGQLRLDFLDAERKTLESSTVTRQR